MAKYKAYPEYKDSGVEWLGVIPKGWTISKVKYLAPFQVGWTPPTKNDANFIGDNLWVNISDLKDKFISSTAKCISDKAAKEASMDITPRGSLLYSFKLSVGAVSFAGCDLYTNEAIASFLDQAQLPLSYLYYALPIFIIENASTNIYGAKILNQELIKNSFLLAPSHSEAKKVAKFLDHETAKIDNLIEKQQQLIELLKEKRQAVISHAVTKGLNPDVPMKDSGVEWLGKVPNHWVSVRVKQISSFITSGPRGWSDFITDEGNEIFLQSGDLNNELGLQLDKAKRVSPPKNAEGVRTKLVTEDVVVCITGANTGRVAIVPELSQTTYINQHLSLIRPNTSIINSSFLGYSLASSVGRSFFDVAQYGLKEGLSLSNVSEAPLALPPKHEQDAIVKYLESIRNNYDNLSRLSTIQIELLKERRTALISAAVTGKIDVRDWVAPDTQDIETIQEAIS
ncbi:restriction endonuclease subunit S [Klebsiella quasipneumoniae]|uniref:restriction endonuclease subunit S n=1 Tax=Klebsiella quasipneumoniae TaxID=1463165 RepID=UPI0022450624|nr:restriction endonuclease subunit S [Klebsiella quasipneumoniae]MCX2315318.1 restriction endonuclease subunit S [Klebsiella quasipneumoniae]